MRKWKLPVLPVKQFLRQRDALFPLCFVFSSTLNLVFFYLGFGFEENIVRKLGFILGCVCFAICCGLALLALLWERRLSLRTLLLLCVPLLFFAVCFAVSFLKFGLYRGQMLRYLEQFICFALPAFFAGICAAAEGGEKRFFSVLESASFLAAPGALIYANSVVFNCLPWNYNANLGVLNYMTMAYTFMPYLLAHTISFIRGGAWTFPFTGRPIKRPQLLRGMFIALYWVAIIASATRGALVCVAFCCVLLIALELVRRTAAAKRATAVSVAMTALLLFNLFVYAPPGLYRISRMNMFLKGLLQGQLVTATRNDIAADWVDELVQADGGEQIVNIPVSSGPESPATKPPTTEPPATEPPATEPPTTEPPTTESPATEPDDIISVPLVLTNRGTRFKLAYKEFLKSPLTGMGPGGYSVKYGAYPHTAFLELLCETGIIGTLIIMVLLLCVFCKMIVCSIRQDEEKNLEMPYLIVFFIVYALQANISGTVWHCPALMAALGFGLALRLPSRDCGRSD